MEKLPPILQPWYNSIEETGSCKRGGLMHGWAGWILRVDLNSGRINRIPLDPDIARKFIGGRGLN